MVTSPTQDTVKQGDIVARTGYSWAFISRIFSGKRLPSFEAARVISSAMGITMEELYAQLRPTWEKNRAMRRWDLKELDPEAEVAMDLEPGL